MTLIPLYAKTFGRLTVIDRTINDARGKPQWLCRCDCGKYATVSGCNLTTGNTQSCGCWKAEIIRDRQCLRPYESLYRIFLRKADHPVALSYEQFLGYTRIAECHYCAASVSWDGTSYNLDRKNNALGYTLDNCVVCCARCNWAKGDHFTYDEWMQLAAVVRTWKK